MDTRFAHALFQALRKDRCSFGYSGSFQDEHTARLIELGEAALGPEGEDGAARSKLAFVMVEAYQNIVRHRAPVPTALEQGAGRSLFLLRCTAHGQHVVAINPVSKADVPQLREQLAHLDGLDRSQLKELFLSGLQRTQDPERRGAGLGLIEMARRSGNVLGHLLSGSGEAYELFLLAVRLGEAGDDRAVIADAVRSHAEVAENDIRFFHVGGRSPAIDEAVTRLMEAEHTTVGRGQAVARGILAAMDIMNAFAGPETAHVRVVAGPVTRAMLVVGAVLQADAQARLEAQVAAAKAWDGTELQRRYRDALLSRNDGDVHVGVIELVRASLEPVEVVTVPVEQGTLVLLGATV
jgi:hypothetical protein